MATVEQLMQQYGLHWFKFDEESGNAIDSKGSAVGTVYANATRVEGWNGMGNAIKFNRTSTSYVNFNARIVPTGSYTFKFKLKLFTIPTVENQELFSNAYATATTTGLRIWIDVNGYIVFASTRKSSGNYDFTLYNMADFDSKWHDYMFTWDTANKIVTVYKDGKFLGKTNSVTANASTPTYNLRMGRQADSSENRYVNAEIDDVQVYDRVLKPDDFSKKYLTVKSLNNKTYVVSPISNRVKEIPSSEEVDLIKQGYQWNEIDSASTSNNIDINQSTTEYEIASKINSSLGSGKIFTSPISNFKTVKIEDNY